ncbi:MAG: hypothetical protein UT34_C0001G0015 [candidate division WS6 bacterium GW2011_GWF2_39_15]|uniref:CYTH domain-containing protein n=1 Tax=candidate division WS6 bacterium GW2011_GWF2_39_15 TaxID=1619100 RepID=A0A0G0Q6C5_9BACT|nr:MAG: hypothetical protein UT34_C0001G0015 [candidate division WS6 bacterium GW2011_GWF2_39_15]
MLEVERRFLLKYIPDNVREVEGTLMEDYMILTGEIHPHLRLRRKGNHYELTKKYQRDVNEKKLEMIEETIILDQREFEALRHLQTKSQKKFRYRFAQGKYTAELDLWTEDLNGLGIVEFEFDSKEEALAFHPPDYCLVEVTDMEWLAGGMISGRRYSELENQLSKLDYNPVFLT